MSVNKFKITQGSITGGTFQLPIVIIQEHDLVGQTELINSEFVEVERAKSINAIVDFEKTRFKPANSVNAIMNKLVFNLNFYNGTTHSNNTWGDIGFTQEDLYYRKNRFMNSFLRLTFYDSKNLMSQTPIFEITLFPQINSASIPNSTTQIQFKRENPITTPLGFAEGYYIYFFKDLVGIDNDFDVYMRAEFLNASDGIKRPLMMYSGVPVYDDTFADKIHLKYTLRKDSENFLYIIDDADTVTYSSNQVLINLYESVTL